MQSWKLNLVLRGESFTVLPADCSMVVIALAQCKPEVICLKAAKKLFGGEGGGGGGGVVKLLGELCCNNHSSEHMLFKLQTRTCAYKTRLGNHVGSDRRYICTEKVNFFIHFFPPIGTTSGLLTEGDR